MNAASLFYFTRLPKSGSFSLFESPVVCMFRIVNCCLPPCVSLVWKSTCPADSLFVRHDRQRIVILFAFLVSSHLHLTGCRITNYSQNCSLIHLSFFFCNPSNHHPFWTRDEWPSLQHACCYCLYSMYSYFACSQTDVSLMQDVKDALYADPCRDMRWLYWMRASLQVTSVMSMYCLCTVCVPCRSIRNARRIVNRNAGSADTSQ